MQTRIFHTVNSGLYLYSGGAGILIDGLHGKFEGFSPVPAPVLAQARAGEGLFAHLDALLFTHFHLDHYDAELVRSVIRSRPGIRVLCPGFPADEETAVAGGAFRIAAIPTVHDGKRYACDTHRSYVIDAGGERFFIPGDARLDPDLCAPASRFGAVDAGFFNIFQVLSSPSRKLIEALRPRRVFLYHLGYPEDDEFGYRRHALSAIGRFPPGLPRPEIPEPMSWIDGAAPEWAR